MQTYNENSSNILQGTTGAETIINYNDGATILAFADNDTVYNNGANVSIDGGAGNDFINNSLAGSNSIIKGWADNDYISNRGSNVTIEGGDGNDSIYNYGSSVTIDGGEGNDSIYNYWGHNASIEGGTGNDSISNEWDNNVSIESGASNDSIFNSGDSVTVNAGAGNDYISNRGSNVTIDAGTGNDTIYNNWNFSKNAPYFGNDGADVVFKYNAGDGNDIVYGFNATSSLQIGNGTTDTYSKSTVGSDVLVTVGSGTITLNGAGSLSTLNILGTEVTIGGGGNSSVTPQDVIKKFMKSLDTTTYSGTAALNQAVSVASGGYFQNINVAITKMVEDCSLATSGTAFLQNYCDIVMYNDDTGAITGFDAGTTTIKTAQSVVPEIGVLDTSFNGSSFTTTNGLTFQLSNTNNLSNDELYMWRALKTWWADSSLNLINESYDYSFNDSDATFNTTRVVFEETSGDYLAATNGTTLYINKYYYYNFSDTDVDGISPLGQAYLDRVLSHELTHATMMAKIYGFWNLPEFITEGMAELTHGIDDTRSARINSLAGNASRLETALSLNSGTGTADAYAGGYMFLRYFAKQASEHYPTVGSGISSQALADIGNSSVSISGALLKIDDTFTGDILDLTKYPSIKKVDAKTMTRGVEIVGNTLNNSIAAGKGNDTISGNSGNDTILGGAGNDIINGDAGNDIISAGTGNDTLTGGTGNDIFIHVEGNEVITDYVEGVDKIKFANEYNMVTSSSLSGNDVILNVREDVITVKDAKDKKITIIDAKGNETSALYGGLNLTVDNSTSAAITLDSSYANVDASERTKAIQITGNAFNNSILGSSKNDTFYGNDGDDKLYGNAGNDKLYGGTGNDTLTGGKGNDSLWGNAGADVFDYYVDDGNDVIFGFDNDDLLKITGDFSSNYNASAKSVAFTVGTGSVTLKDFGTTTTFHVNDETYQISNNKFVKK